MKRVTGIGGVFFKCKNTKTTMAWYENHLGVEPDGYGGAFFEWKELKTPKEIGVTVFSAFDLKSDYYKPSKAPFMINFRVANLEKLMKQLKKEGVKQIGKIDKYEYGKFGWVMDPNGVKIELWEPVKGYRFKRKGAK